MNDLCDVPVRRKRHIERCARSADDCQIYYRGFLIADMGICKKHLRLVMLLPVTVLTGRPVISN